jgi:predicted thioesterase
VSDEQEVIAKGTHERFIVDLDKFGARLAEKAASLNP